MAREGRMSDAEILDRDEALPAEITDAVDASLAVGLSRAEIDTQITTARRYPRQLTKVSQHILSLATLDEETAEESMYALPRGGKPIKGPSIRFAEIVKSSYGNCRAAARVVHVDRVEKVVIAEGVFHDLETNTATRAEVRRRICDKYGRIYKDDMIIVTGNAACSIALRNAILGGVPKALWRKAYDAVQHTIAGDIKTLAETRDKAVKALANFGVTPEQIFTALGVAGMDDVSIEHIPTLRGMFAALKNGEATVEEMFSTTVAAASSHAKVENPLSDSPPAPPANTGGANQTDTIPRDTTEPAGDTDAASSAGEVPNSNPLTEAATETPAGNASGGEQAGGDPLPSQPAGLPQGWEMAYATALKMAVKPASLPKFAKQYWDQHGGWDAHKDGPNADTAVAVYQAFEKNFAKHEERDAILHELGAA
jgi:hypothetical protein